MSDGRFSSVTSLREALSAAQPASIVPLVKLICRISQVKPIAIGDIGPSAVCIDIALARSPAAEDGWAAMSDGRFASVSSLRYTLSTAEPGAIVPLVKLICRITHTKPLANEELAVTAAAVKAALDRAPPASGGWAALADTPAPSSSPSRVAVRHAAARAAPSRRRLHRSSACFAAFIESSPPERDVLVLAASAVMRGSHARTLTASQRTPRLPSPSPPSSSSRAPPPRARWPCSTSISRWSSRQWGLPLLARMRVAGAAQHWQ